MRQTTGTRKSPGEKIVKGIKRATRSYKVINLILLTRYTAQRVPVNLVSKCIIFI